MHRIIAIVLGLTLPALVLGAAAQLTVESGPLQVVAQPASVPPICAPEGTSQTGQDPRCVTANRPAGVGRAAPGLVGSNAPGTGGRGGVTGPVDAPAGIQGGGGGR